MAKKDDENIFDLMLGQFGEGTEEESKFFEELCDLDSSPDEVQKRLNEHGNMHFNMEHELKKGHVDKNGFFVRNSRAEEEDKMKLEQFKDKMKAEFSYVFHPELEDPKCVLKIYSIFKEEDPVLFGVEVLQGSAEVGAFLYIPLKKNMCIGRIVSMKHDANPIQTAIEGQKVAVEILGSNFEEKEKMFGRDFGIDDVLVTSRNVPRTTYPD